MRIDRVKLIAEMAKQNIGVAELAEKAGVSRVTVTSLRGGKSCSENSVRCIAEALGVTVEDLQAGETHDAPKDECGKEPEEPWVEAWYTGEKWADGTEVARVTIHGNIARVINLIATLATELIETHASQKADKQATIDDDTERLIAAIRKNAKTISAKFATEGKDKTKRMVS